MNKITILGGGIGGLSTAIALQKIGLDVVVYESAPQIKPLGAGLALAANAIKSLQEIGLYEKILPYGKLLDKLIILDQLGGIITQTDTSKIRSLYGIDNFTIHRADLHKVLVEALKPNTLILGKSLKSFKQNSASVQLEFTDGSSADTQYLIAADGINSLVRQQLLPKSEKRYSGYTCWRGVVDTSLAKVDYNIATETWGTKGRFGIVPLKGNRTYWFATVNAEKNSQKMKDMSPIGLKLQFANYHEPIADLLLNTSGDKMIWSDIYDIAPVKQFAFNNILLLGDAAHATTPNMGQGACQAIEDAVHLMYILKKETELQKAFKLFEAKRVKKTSWIITNSSRIGKIGQLENPILIAARNAALRLAPESTTINRLKKIYEVDFSS